MRAGATIDAILAFLAEFGEGTVDEFMADQGKGRRAVRSAIQHERSERGTQRLRILRHVPRVGRGGKASLVYALGPGPDAPKPKALNNNQRQARYRERHRAALRVKWRVRHDSPLANNPFAGLLR